MDGGDHGRSCDPARRREEAALAAVILRGPEPDRDGCCAWTRGDLCRWMAAHFGKTYHPSSMTRVLRRMGFSRQKARPAHPKRDQKAQDRFEKTYGPPRPQGLFARRSDRSASTYPVSELPPRPRWRSARSGPHKGLGVDAPFFRSGFQSAGSTVRPSRFHHSQISVLAQGKLLRPSCPMQR